MTSMPELALFVCSYGRDALRTRRLIDSLDRHNVGGLSLFVAIPHQHRRVFFDTIGRGRATWIDQEEVYELSPSARVCEFERVPGSHLQQVVKAEAWRLRAAENLLVLDSDCMFLRAFCSADLVDSQRIPVTILEPAEAVRQLAVRLKRPKIWKDWLSTSDRARELVGRWDHARWSFGGAPFVWSAQVWRDLDSQVLAPSGKTILDAIRAVGSELVIYGEAALALGSIPIRVSSQLFKIYHYEQDYWLDQARGATQSDLAHSHMGVVYQSNWQHELDHPDYRRPMMSRVRRQLRRAVARTAWNIRHYVGSRPRSGQTSHMSA
jgi:hypothetical protein